MSLLTLKRLVKKMIDEEDTAKPLTDEQIAKKLEDNGIHVTRRTVAKYREDMRIPEHAPAPGEKLSPASREAQLTTITKPRASGRQLVILTGLSGSGKSTVLKAFEDMGYHCVDNLPVELIPIFAELHAAGDGDYRRAALLVDAREGLQLEKLPGLLKHLRRDHPITLVYHRGARRRAAAAL